MSIDFNQLLKQADAAGFSLIPNGDYDVVIEKAIVKPTSTGKQMIAVTYAVEHGPHAKRKLFNNHTLSPENDNALGFFFREMATYGFPREYWTQPGASLENVAAQLPGRQVTVEVGTRKWGGEDRNDVKKVKPRSGIAAGGVVPGPGAVAAPPVVVPGAAVPGPAAAAVPSVVVPQPQAEAPAPAAPVIPTPEPYYGNDEEPF